MHPDIYDHSFPSVTCLSCLYRKRSRQDFSQLPRPAPQTGHPTPPAALPAKAERRRFMSGKAADVHRTAAPQAQPQKRRRVPGQPEGSGLIREDFLTMQREVQTFGERCCPVLVLMSEYVRNTIPYSKCLQCHLHLLVHTFHRMLYNHAQTLNKQSLVDKV